MLIENSQVSIIKILILTILCTSSLCQSFSTMNSWESDQQGLNRNTNSGYFSSLYKKHRSALWSARYAGAKEYISHFIGGNKPISEDENQININEFKEDQENTLLSSKKSRRWFKNKIKEEFDQNPDFEFDKQAQATLLAEKMLMDQVQMQISENNEQSSFKDVLKSQKLGALLAQY